MGFIEVRVNKDEVTTWLQDKVDDLPTQAGDMVEEVLNIYELVAGVEAPYRTGDLRNSHQVEMLGGLEGYMTPTIYYAKWVIEGTSPYTIEPVNKQALYWPGAAHPVLRVNHPGIRANDYVADAFGEADVDPAMERFMDWLSS